MQGKIIKGIAGFYYIYAEDGNVYECKAKGIFRKDNFKPLVGDNAEISVLDQEAKEGSVTAILPQYLSGRNAWRALCDPARRPGPA